MLRKEKCMKEIEIFKSEEFGEIRTLEIDGKPYFVASDIAKALGYSNISDAVARHCRWVVKHDIPHPQSKTKTLKANVIPEGDLYRLISGSELDSAERFESYKSSFLNHGYLTKYCQRSVKLAAMLIM